MHEKLTNRIGNKETWRQRRARIMRENFQKGKERKERGEEELQTKKRPHREDPAIRAARDAEKAGFSFWNKKPRR
jgi:hypothetical protein